MTPHTSHPAMSRAELRLHLERDHALSLTGFLWSVEELAKLHDHGHALAQPAWVRRKNAGLLPAKDTTGRAA